MGKYNTYSAAQQDFLKDNASLLSRSELAAAFNKRFGTAKSVRAIKSYCNARGWGAKTNGKFKRGNVSWQKGLSTEEFKAHYTQESYRRMRQKVADANKTKSIGDEIVIDGEPWVVASLDYSKPYYERRVPKRRYVWEQAYGAIPKDHCIINLDRDHLNCKLENLYCMPTRFRTILSKNGWWFADAQLTLTAIKWCELFYAIRGLGKTEDNT